jgi:hypothetical protein
METVIGIREQETLRFLFESAATGMDRSGRHRLSDEYLRVFFARR